MSKKITIANSEVLSNGTGDEVRNYLYRWLVVNGQVQYAKIVPPGSSDLSFDLS